MLKHSLYVVVLLVVLTKVCNGMQPSSKLSDEAFNTLRSEILSLRQEKPLLAIERLGIVLEEKKHLLTLRQTLRLTYAQALFQIISNLTDEALNTLFKCKALSNELGEPQLDYYYYSYSGRLFNQLGIYDLALENYQKGYEISIEINSQQSIKQSENNIGHTFLNLKKYDEAKTYFESFYQYNTENNFPSSRAAAINNLGEIALFKGNIPEALDLFEHALAINEQHKFEENSAWPLQNIGKTYRIKKQYFQAIEYIERSIAIHNKFANTIEALNIQLELAAVYQEQNQQSQAIDLLIYIAQTAKEKAHYPTIYRAQSMLTSSYSAIKNYELALQASEYANLAQTTMLEQKTKASFQHIVASTALQTKELEVTNLKKENEMVLEKQRYAQQRTRNLLISGFIIITATLLFIFHIRRKNKKLRLTLNELETTQKQLIESEKVSALTTLVSGMAHQLNTPLGIIVTANSIQQEKLQQLESLIENQKLTISDMNSFVLQSKDAIALSQNNTHKADEMIRRFKLISAELEGSVLSHFSLEVFISSKLKLLTNQTSTPVKFQVNGIDTSIYNYSDILFKVFSQLVINTIDHKRPDVPEVEITVNIRHKKDKVIIEYLDNGPGIESHLISKVFDPFFSTKGMQTGLGLGLNIAHNYVVHLMQGNLTCHSSKSGAMFIIELPNKFVENAS